MKHIPNFITSLNLSAGFAAIIFAANNDTVTASWLILAAMVFDFFDGFSARILKAYSEIGRELDSLADVVSFGVAPAVIMYKLISFSINSGPGISSSEEATILDIIALAVPVLMPLCAALRLAKFNVDTTQSVSFKGLPTPSNAIGVISVVIAANYTSSPLIDSFTGSGTALVVYTLILSFLMITNIPLLSLKIKDLKFKGNQGRYLLIVLVLISAGFLGLAAAPLIIPFYIAASFLERIFWQN